MALIHSRVAARRVLRDLGPLSGDRRREFTGRVFVGHQTFLNVGFGVARARLADLAHDGLLARASRDAYDEAASGLGRVGPPGLSELSEVQARDLVIGEGSAVLTLRWQAIGSGGALFPVLDADIKLAAAGDQAAILRLDGTYRPPPWIASAGLDRAVLHRAATATVQEFLGRIAEAIADPAAAAWGKGTTGTESDLPRRPPADTT